MTRIFANDFLSTFSFVEFVSFAVPFFSEPQAMAQLEREHEAYFLGKVAGHPSLSCWQKRFGWGPETTTQPTHKNE